MTLVFPGFNFDTIIYCFGSMSAKENSGFLPGVSSGQGRDETNKSSEFSIKAPSINLPKGGGAIKGIGEKFAANPVTGTGSMTVPIATSPGRSGFGPQLALSYDSGSGNGPFGFGWSLFLPSITRKTDKGLPQYRNTEESDVFILSGAEDLVPEFEKDANNNWSLKDGKHVIHDKPRTVNGTIYNVRRYRPRIEGLFARIERWTNQADAKDIFWRSISKDNITTWYGKTENSRILDPAEPSHIFRWLISQSYDDKGNVIVYKYSEENSERIFEDQNGNSITLAHERNRDDKSRSANRYLKRICYGNRLPYFPKLTEADWPQSPDPKPAVDPPDYFFEVVFDYDDGHYKEADPDVGGRIFAQPVCTPLPDAKWPARVDPFSSYRAGFEIRTYRLCQRVLMFHHFPNELSTLDYLVRSTDFTYSYEDNPASSRNPIYSFLDSVTQSGYVRQKNGKYLKRSLPPVEFKYSQPVVQNVVKDVDPESLENLPVGVDGSTYQWTDLHGEGIPGILTEQAGSWFYKRNLSPIPIKDNGTETIKARFAPLEKVAVKPNLTMVGGAQFMDLAGDGQPDLVVMDGPVPGLYEHDEAEGWNSFRPFSSRLTINTHDPNLKLIDLDGDGHTDILITEDDSLIWYSSLAEEGFGPAHRVQKDLDEEKGPRLVFADGTQSIYLADLSGDGLTDLCRIRNGEICYWPNHGYCKFGPKVTMDNSPWFDTPDQFDLKRIRLADIDGSGTTDIIYLHGDGVRLYFNQSGNSWSSSKVLNVFPQVEELVSIIAIDLLGNGTACLVWSSPLPGDAQWPMRYVNLMGEKKPHLLEKTINNLGAETHVQYAPSTKFYLADKRDGKPWVTRLPFPVHVVERVETYDWISKNIFVTRYAYHHGFFDGEEREFRGFGLIEQWDTEEFEALAGAKGTFISMNAEQAWYVPPVLTRTWFHTGVYIGPNHVSDFFAGFLDANDIGEYYREPAWRTNDIESRKRLLNDTTLPVNLSIEEEHEACRALKGSMLRQEVYALDGSGTPEYPFGHPYTVTEQNFVVLGIQLKAANRHGVFFVHPHEALSYHYERNPVDPRVSHTMTLEVDKQYGQVRKSLSIGYGRRSSSLQGNDKIKQEQTLITYTEYDFTNAIDKPVYDPNYDPDNYRTPLPCETRTYEISGFKPDESEIRLTFDTFTENNFQALQGLQEIGYEESVDYTKKQKRLIEQMRTLYRSNDMGASHADTLALLPIGTIESLALPGETYKLAFTPSLLDQAYIRKGQNLLQNNVGDMLEGGGSDKGGYVKIDGKWWIPSGRVFYSPDKNDTSELERTEADRHFFVPRRYRDPFHKLDGSWNTETFVDYDAYDLLVRETRDALDNQVTIGERHYVLPDGTVMPEKQGNDYRILQPRLMMDPNRNRSEVVFDSLGLVVGTAVMGKPEDTPVKGDLLDEDFKTDLIKVEIDAFYDAVDPQIIAPDLLLDSTTRIVYDFNRFRLSRIAHSDEPEKWQPVFAATMARETHASDLGDEPYSKIQISFSYSDGFGREIQKKIQAEKGKVPQRDEQSKIIIGSDNQPVMSSDENLRWVGSGWTIFNNKGKPVRQFEPFFSDTHKPDFDTKLGVSPVLFYDPVERVVATLHPNNTYEKVVFDPWHQASYDVNDTVANDPRSDATIKEYVKKFLSTQPGWKTWLQQHFTNPSNPPPDTRGTDPECDSAVRALKHADTPTIAHFDSLGRTFLTVADNGNDPDGNPQKYETRVMLDIEGNQHAVIDAKGRVVIRYDYDLLGNQIHQASMEAGERWMLNDVTGKPALAWDGRGHNFTTKYDQLRRPTWQSVRGTDDAQSDQRTLNKDIRFGRTEYGENQINDIVLNLRTRVYRQHDGAGVVSNEAYDFKGNLLRSSRQVASEYKTIIDWTTAQPEGDNFSSTTSYDALNRPITLIAPDNSIIRPTYNEANLLNALEARLRGTTNATPFITNIDYNAKGQRIFIDYGNGATTQYVYDEKTFRLNRLRTVRGKKSNSACAPLLEPRTCEDPPNICKRLSTKGCIVQDLNYTYDPAGNITHIRDNAQQIIYFRNKRVEPSNDYIYDSIYRLIDATGREHLGQNDSSTALPPRPASYNDWTKIRLPHPGDGNAMGLYREVYAYDEVGNFIEMVHRGTDPAHPGWTRAYAYNEKSLLEGNKKNNRLTSTTVSDSDEIYSADGDGYDAHGNMLHMPHLQEMRWDFQDRLLMTQRQKVNNDEEDGVQHNGERTWYVYDSSGQRVRKVTDRATVQGQESTRMNERIYVGGFEIYRDYKNDGASTTVERETLHIMDEKQRIALVETKTAEAGVISLLSSLFTSPKPLIRYQFSNHLGTTCLELDDQAKLISYEEYTPYGSTTYQSLRQNIEVPTKRYRYTGKERDEESGLYYHVARYYAPWLSRWTKPDVKGLADGPDVYVYCRSNPIIFQDLSGSQAMSVGQLMLPADLYRFYGQNASVPTTPTERLKQTILMLQKHGLPVKSLRTVAETVSIKETNGVDCYRPFLKRLELSFEVLESGKALESGAFTIGTSLHTLYHESTHAFMGIQGKSDTHLRGLMERGINYYRKAPLKEVARFAEDPERLFHEAAAGYVESRAGAYIDTRQKLLFGASSQKNYDVLVERARIAYNKAMSEQAFGYENPTLYEGFKNLVGISRVPEELYTSRPIFPELKQYLDKVVLEGRVKERFEDVPEFQTIIRQVSEKIGKKERGQSR